MLSRPEGKVAGEGEEVFHDSTINGGPFCFCLYVPFSKAGPGPW